MNLVSFSRTFSRTFTRSTVPFLLSRRDVSSTPEEAEPKCSGEKSGILGINIGFSNIYAAVMDGENPRFIPTIPSTITFYQPNESFEAKVSVGVRAKIICQTNPQACILGICRMVGLKFDDPILQKELRKFPVSENTMRNDKGQLLFVASEKKGKKRTTRKMLTNVLKKLRHLARKSTKKVFLKAVFAVPPNFSKARVKGLYRASKNAGFETLKFISEPVAAALSYHLDRNDGCFFVYDFGGGSFDCSVVRSYNGVLKVEATSHHTSAGGTAFDGEVVKYILHKTEEEIKDKLRTKVCAVARMFLAVEKAKKKLGSGSEKFSLKKITIDEGGKGIDTPEITGDEIEDILKKWLPKTGEVCENCLKKAKVTVDNIDGVVLVGGMCHLSEVQKFVRNFFGKDPLYHPNRDVDSVIAVGAAIRGVQS